MVVKDHVSVKDWSISPSVSDNLEPIGNLSFVSNRMSILGKYLVQDSFGKPEIKIFCYHTTCDLSCASVTAEYATPKAEFICYYRRCLLFLVNLHFTLSNVI